MKIIEIGTLMSADRIKKVNDEFGINYTSIISINKEIDGLVDCLSTKLNGAIRITQLLPARFYQ